MKKIGCLLLAAALVLLLAACKKQPSRETGETRDPSPAVSPSNETGEVPAVTPSLQPTEAEEMPDGELRFDLPMEDIRRLISFVSAVNPYPQEFTDSSQLTDTTMLFAAAKALDVMFQSDDGGYTSYITLTSLHAKVREIFGANAALSDGFAAGDYYPYSVDISSDRLLRGTAGGMAEYYFPYRLLNGEESMELWLIDLMDPLFFGEESNRNRLLNGEEIAWADIREIAGDMQKNIYTIGRRNGALVLTGFRYENEKDIDHFAF